LCEEDLEGGGEIKVEEIAGSCDWREIDGNEG